MDAVTLAVAQAAAKKTYIPRRGPFPIRGRDFPGAAGIPTVDTSPGTATLSAANAASAITSKVSPPVTRTYFRPFGVEPKFGASFPDNQGWQAQGVYTYASNPPWAVEFDLDTVGGTVEIKTKGSGGKMRVLVNGKLLSATPITLPNDGNSYLVTVALTAGQYRLRVEMDGTGRFWGVNVGPTDGVTAAPRRGLRVAALGDSFWEPTLADSTAFCASQGLPGILSYVTGWDVFACGSGGTGLVNPGTGGRVKYADRIAEVLAISGLDVLLVAMSSNDSASTAAQVSTQAQAVITAAKAAGLTGYGQIIFLSPWWNKGSQGIPASVLAQDDAVAALCATQDIPFVESLQPPVSGAVSTTLAAASAANATSVSAVAAIPVNAWMKVGSAGAAEIRQVTSSSGAGPYTLGVGGTFPFLLAHGSGDPVVQVDASDLTGNGSAASPNGSGNADRYTGTDGTHPSIAGAMYRAKRIAARMLYTLPH
jgi:lysophospholipase L1-like esterase